VGDDHTIDFPQNLRTNSAARKASNFCPRGWLAWPSRGNAPDANAEQINAAIYNKITSK
jgi:hypothetical protein